MTVRALRKRRSKAKADDDEVVDLPAQERLELRRIINRGHHARDNAAFQLQKLELFHQPQIRAWHESTGRALQVLMDTLAGITPKPNWPFPPPAANFEGLKLHFKTVVQEVEVATDTLLDELDL